MPNRQLTNQDKFATICDWLMGNLSDVNSFNPISNQIPSITSKGIYFWFMRSEGYKELSKFIKIVAIKSKYVRVIKGQNYDLVYIGTAGVRNNKNGINNGGLQQRFNWHIVDNQNESAICSGTMSTFRRTLIPLFSEDLLLNYSQTKLNSIFEKYFKVFYISYLGTFLDVKDMVDSDESLLIDRLKPIFNISKNNNAKILGHITAKISQRRNLIEKNTKERLGCITKNNKSEMIKVKIKKQTVMKTNSEIPNIESPSNRCIEFTVLQNQNLVNVASLIQNLPSGKCSIEIWDPSTREPVYPPIRKITKNGRSVMEYFNAPDTARGNKAKWQILQDEMIDRNIKEINVKVCAQNQVNDIKESNWDTASESEKAIILKIADRYEKIKNMKKVYLIPCSGKKESGGNQISNVNALFQNEILGNCREKLIAMYNANNPQNQLDWSETMPAIDRYRGIWYSEAVKDAIRNNPDRILIVSALFGIIKPTDLIPNYDLSMKNSLNDINVYIFWKQECEKCILNRALIAHKNSNPGMVYINLLTKAYQKAFCNFIEVPNMHPANNYIPDLIDPTNRGLYDNRGHWIKNHLLENL